MLAQNGKMAQPFHNHYSYTKWTKGQCSLVAYKKWYAKKSRTVGNNCRFEVTQCNDLWTIAPGDSYQNIDGTKQNDPTYLG